MLAIEAIFSQEPLPWSRSGVDMEKCLVLMSLLVGGLACNAACAQVLGSSLSGKIGTSANSWVPNVTLTLKNTSNAAT